MKTKIISALFALVALLLHGGGTEGLKLEWSGPPGMETNGAVFNVRALSAGSVVSNYFTWPILFTLTNSTSHLIYSAYSSQLYAITLTNIHTGVESVEHIGPVRAKYYNKLPLTNSTVEVLLDDNGDVLKLD